MAVPNYLHEALSRHVLERPHAVAIRHAGRSYGYAELAHLAAQAAALLHHRWGIRRGDRVAWLGLNHVGQIALLFALARVGAVLVPLNFRLAETEWDAVLADCAPRCVVHDDAWSQAALALAARAGIAAHHVDTLLAPQGESADAPGHAGPADAVLLVYTSGTTGKPKGAVHTQANLLANMAMAAQVQDIAPDDVVATVLPLFHVGGLCIQTLPALYAGATVLLHARFDPAATLECVTRDRPTLTLQVPATMKALIEHPGWGATDLSSLRAVWAGSSTLPLHLIDAFHARGVPVCNVYGATETGPFSIALGIEHAFSHAGSCGWPAPGVEARLFDAKDGVGEVALRAANVVKRYWPDTPACDGEGWFRSGDLARQAQDGSYWVVGRAKDMVISGGENIYPAEIESLLAAVEGVAEVAVVGLPDAQWGEVVVAAVVAAPGAQLNEQALRDALQGKLARYKQPRRYMMLDALPKTALGKVQKARLVALLQP